MNTAAIKDKAKRLIKTRTLARLDRNHMAQMANVSFNTYKGWENARFGGIPEKRAVLLSNALQMEGIDVSVNWLMFGSGEEPKKLKYHQIEYLKQTTINLPHQSPEEVEKIRIKAELEFFANNNGWENIIYLNISDDTMAPCFIPSDLVIGIKITKENFNQAIGLNCLVRTKENKILLRQLQPSKTNGLFTLLCINQNTRHQFILNEIELIDIAPVVWIRKNSFYLLKNEHKK